MRSCSEKIVLLAVVALSCGSPESVNEADGTWVGTITSEGNVTTVRNISGSLWGYTARLIEETSIGVEAGADPYMFGQVVSVAASDDRIYVADRQVRAVRAYSWAGKHIRDLGREGQGPGEFVSVYSIGVDGEQRVWVHDARGHRIVVYSGIGEPIATLSKKGPIIGGSFPPIVVTSDGRAYVYSYQRATGSSPLRRGMTPYTLDGAVGEWIGFPVFERPAFLQAEGGGWIRDVGAPFHPRGIAAFGPAPALLSGHPSAYRFQIDDLDGARTIVEREDALVPVDPGEADAHQRAAKEYLRAIDPGWKWPELEIPDTKPAYSDLIPAISGEVWAIRQGRGTRVPDCDEEDFEPTGEPPCWHEERIVDAFGNEGRYLGEVIVPADLRFDPRPFIRDRDVIGVVEDEAGTIMVKRYRVVLPGEQ